MPVHRLGAGHDLTCERAYSGYEIANTPVQDAGKDRKVQFEYITNTLHKVEGQLNILTLLSWHGGFYMNPFNAYNFLLLYV
jgi:hypothetical protein